MIRPILSYYGGKTKLAKRINSCFLPCRTLVGTHAGGMSVELNAAPAQVQIANDFGPGLINLYNIVQSRTDEFVGLLRLQPLNQWTFEYAKEWMSRVEDPLLRAVGYLIRNRWSFSSTGRTFMVDRMGPNGCDWLPFVNQIHKTANRMRAMRFLNRDAVDVIQEYDHPTTLFYVDPPYMEDERSADRHYEVEMTVAQHQDLLKVLRECKGMVYLSGYRSPLYDEMLSDWIRVDWPVISIMSGKKGRGRGRIESMWSRGNAGLYMLSQYS